MKTLQVLISLVMVAFSLQAQSVKNKLAEAVKNLLADEQMKHAIMGLYVVNSVTGAEVYSLNDETGLAPASCQKIITSIAAFDLLGPGYRYKTELGYDGNIKNGELNGNLYLIGYGDPTLASWRYAETKDSMVLNKWANEIKSAGIKKIKGDVYLDNSKFSFQPLPGGWIWDDIGNYYGAGTWGLNWHENQYDLILQPGQNEGDDVVIKASEPELQVATMLNLLKTGKKGSGDNGYIYLSPYNVSGFVEGTVPAGEKEFRISGSFPNPSSQLSSALHKIFASNDIQLMGHFKTSEEFILNKQLFPEPRKIFYTHVSPPLDSINYWFLQKSINLYGEAFIKTIAFEKSGIGSTDSGIAIVRDFWQERGIEKPALHIIDGSGLSPQNRITAHSLVTALQYAGTRNWFSSFYNALPEHNQMKLKSGSINGAKSFAGYHIAKDGTQYTVAIIINNFDGSSASLVNKMFVVLNQLK